MIPKTVLITGCGPSGIGHALALEFQIRGHRVIASGLDGTLLSPFRELGIDTVVLDVTSEKSIAIAASHVSKLTDGKLDILVNNAGLMHIMPMSDTSIPDARRVLEANVLGVVAVTQAFLPLLIASANATVKGNSMIANLGSVNQVFCPPFFGIYNASKAAVEALSTTMRRELAPLGVKVVLLKTGSIRTGLFENTPGATKLPENSLYGSLREWVEGRKMLESGRFMQPDVYAQKVVDELLRKDVRSVVWQGGLATLAWVLSWLGWESMLDGEMIKGNKLNNIRLRQY
ncbi:IBR finger domain protein (short-chain dehydrogenase) [Seiridium cupressi]